MPKYYYVAKVPVVVMDEIKELAKKMNVDYLEAFKKIIKYGMTLATILLDGKSKIFIEDEEGKREIVL